MISPKEVQKGSIVSYEGKTRIVKGVMDYIILEGTKEWIGGSLINPEPISEVWLKNLGLSLVQEGSMAQPTIYRKEYSRRLVISNFDIQYRGGDEWYWIDGNTIVELQYVHQLQMLYFSLSGNHLVIPKIKK